MIVESKIEDTQEEEVEERQWHGTGALQVHLMSSGTVAETELHRYREDKLKVLSMASWLCWANT